MKRTGLPVGVVALGWVSLFMDLSSEMIHSLLPVYLVSVMGVSTMTVGVIEGVAEAIAAFMKTVSGAISDWIGRRKPLVLVGYGMAALVKPLFPIAQDVATIVTARFVDRVGKGVRGAPRDALIADLTPPGARGAAFGFRQSMDTVGAVAGPVVAISLMAATAGDFRLVLWASVIPAAVAVAIVVFGVREPETHAHPVVRKPIALHPRELRQLPTYYWACLAVAGVLTLARFSEAFMLLRASDVGLEATWTPAVLVAMNAVYAISAWPLGRLADRMDRRHLLSIGIFLLSIADVVLGLASSAGTLMLGAALWGLHMGATQGLLSALVADAAPDHLRGTAFGLFSLVIGCALLIASAGAGALWSAFGPLATFAAGAVLSAIAGIWTLALPRAQAAVQG
jgi:MFS family permease